MLVFDPLAILLVIAAHSSLEKVFRKPYPKLSERITDNNPPTQPTKPETLKPKNPPLKFPSFKNGSRQVPANSFPDYFTTSKWNSLTHKEKYELAIKWDWIAVNGEPIKKAQPLYASNLNNFLPK